MNSEIKYKQIKSHDRIVKEKKCLFGARWFVLTGKTKKIKVRSYHRKVGTPMQKAQSQHFINRIEIIKQFKLNNSGCSRNDAVAQIPETKYMINKYWSD